MGGLSFQSDINLNKTTKYNTSLNNSQDAETKKETKSLIIIIHPFVPTSGFPLPTSTFKARPQAAAP